MQLKRNQNIYSTAADALEAIRTNTSCVDGEIITSRYDGGSYLAALHIQDNTRYWNVWGNTDRVIGSSVQVI